MHGNLRRRQLERLGRLLQEKRRRSSKKEQSQRGWYDNDGVRQGGLIAFVRYFWSILEPSTPFVDGWPLWAMCEHLEAVTFGEITRLLINVPPGFMKSLLTDVFWPAWEWGPMGKAHYRYVTFSYSASLTERDNDRFRTLVTSRRYQDLYGPIKTTAAGINIRNKTITKVMNTATGWKLASSVGGVGTGERGDRVLIDDPHNVIEAESDIVRAETVRWFRESISSRFNDLDTGALVIIMQRVHQDDVSGTVLGPDFDYTHLMIPWEFDPERITDNDGSPVETIIGWYDPRLDDEDCEDGAPAWPERFSDAAIGRTKNEIGPYAWASQYQQAPAPRGGGLFKREWWRPWDSKDGTYPLFDYIVASLDAAVTEKQENNPSGFTVWGVFQIPQEPGKSGLMLIDAWRKRLNMHGGPTPRLDHEAPQIGDTPLQRAKREVMWKNRVSEHWGLVEWVAYTCRLRRVDLLLIEGEKGGIIALQEIQRLYGDEGWAAQSVSVRGDKYARALAVVPMFSQGKIWTPVKDWAETVIEEMEVFPRHKYDDLTDSATQALNYLRRVGLAQTDVELQADERDRLTLRPKQRALYPV